MKKYLLFFWIVFILSLLALNKCHAQEKKDTTMSFRLIDNMQGPIAVYINTDSYQTAEKFAFADKFATWLLWKNRSDTLELIPPIKVHYIKIGKKIIRLQ